MILNNIIKILFSEGLKSAYIFFIMFVVFSVSKDSSGAKVINFKMPFSRDSRRYSYSGSPLLGALIATAFITNLFRLTIAGSILFVVAFIAMTRLLIINYREQREKQDLSSGK